MALAGMSPVAAAETMFPATPEPSPATYMPLILVSKIVPGFDPGDQTADGLPVGQVVHGRCGWRHLAEEGEVRVLVFLSRGAWPFTRTKPLKFSKVAHPPRLLQKVRGKSSYFWV